jgi:hypothetical protein
MLVDTQSSNCAFPLADRHALLGDPTRRIVRCCPDTQLPTYLRLGVCVSLCKCISWTRGGIFCLLAKKQRIFAFCMAHSHKFLSQTRYFHIGQNAERAEIFLYNLDKLPLNTVYSIGFDRSCIRPVQGLGFSAGSLWRMLFGMYL